jgi:hypothetical protein
LKHHDDRTKGAEASGQGRSGFSMSSGFGSATFEESHRGLRSLPRWRSFTLSKAAFDTFNHQRGEQTMKNALIAVSIALAAAGAHAQATTAVKEAGKATAETTKQGVENAKAATSSEPAKTVHKVKAKVHKAKAKHAATESKDAAKAAVK